MLKPGGIDDYRLCTSFKNIFKIFYFGPKSTPIQPLNVPNFSRKIMFAVLNGLVL